MAVETGKQLRHLAVIMDGNGRWAKKHGVARLEGHRAGAEAGKRIIELAGEFGIEYLTLYAFSTENWKRSAEEVNGLMRLLKEFIDYNLQVLQENNIRLRAIGRIAALPDESREALQRGIEQTKNNDGGNLILAINYGGRAEIVDAARKIAVAALNGKINPDELDETTFRDYLYAPDIPDPDLMIRTSGELRLSNFLIWELSYAEFYVTDTLWPDFDREDMAKAVDGFYHRERRYGGRLK
ncbi:MAG: isoprenyl transferase [Victivallales bacterium]|nr:isoprenyl transferase [Victivallales bacterium]